MLFVSGYAPESAFGAGGLPPETEFLAKPFTPDQLTQRVTALLAGR